MNTQSSDAQSILRRIETLEDMQNRRLKQIAVGGLLVLAAAFALSANGRQSSNSALTEWDEHGHPVTQPSDEASNLCEQFSQPFQFGALDEKEKKLPTRVTFLLEDQSLADGYLALQEYTTFGFLDAHVSLNSLAYRLQGECRERMQEFSTLQGQVKDLQRQVSLLQKELRAKPAKKETGPKPF